MPTPFHPRHFLSPKRATIFVIVLTAVALATFVACDESGSEVGSGAKPITLSTTALTEEGVNEPLTNAVGWSVQLSKATISIGALYYFDGAPIFSYRYKENRHDKMLRFIGIGIAHAHPGHYQAGNALGQMLEDSSVDLVKTENTLPDGDGITGTYRSARFTFASPAQGPFASQLGDHLIVFEGEATKDTSTINFRFEIDEQDVLDSYGKPELEGCTIEGEPVVSNNGTMTIVFRPSIWFDQVDFVDVTPASNERITVDRENRAFKALARGLKKGDGYRFRFTPKP